MVREVVFFTLSIAKGLSIFSSLSASQAIRSLPLGFFTVEGEVLIRVRLVFPTMRRTVLEVRSLLELL